MKICEGEGKGCRVESRGVILKRKKKRQAGEQSDKGQKEDRDKKKMLRRGKITSIYRRRDVSFYVEETCFSE